MTANQEQLVHSAGNTNFQDATGKTVIEFQELALQFYARSTTDQQDEHDDPTSYITTDRSDGQSIPAKLREGTEPGCQSDPYDCVYRIDDCHRDESAHRVSGTPQAGDSHLLNHHGWYHRNNIAKITPGRFRSICSHS